MDHNEPRVHNLTIHELLRKHRGAILSIELDNTEFTECLAEEKYHKAKISDESNDSFSVTVPDSLGDTVIIVKKIKKNSNESRDNDTNTTS